MLKSSLIVSAFLFVNVAFGQEETQCKGVDLNMTDKQKGQITDCLTEAGIKSIWKMPAERLSCFGVCILQKKEMLTPDGKINQPKVISYIDLVMRPDDVKKPLTEGVNKCIKEHGDKVKGKDGEDPTCISFMEVGQCVHDVFLDICID